MNITLYVMLNSSLPVPQGQSCLGLAVHVFWRRSNSVAGLCHGVRLHEAACHLAMGIPTYYKEPIAFDRGNLGSFESGTQLDMICWGLISCIARITSQSADFSRKGCGFRSLLKQVSCKIVCTHFLATLNKPGVHCLVCSSPRHGHDPFD